jgi:PAS domain-containing protein
MNFIEQNALLIFNNLNTLVYIIDQNYKIVDFNNAFAEHVKLSRKNIVGQPCYKLSHNSDIPCWKMEHTICPARNAFEKNKKCRTIHKHFSKDKVVVEEVVSTPIENAQYVLEEYRNLSDLLGLDQGILPICAGCKKIRDSHGDWHQIEGYFHNKTGTDFSHSICPECKKHFYSHLNQGKKK